MVRAIAIVHGDSTDDPIGMLIFTQKNPNSPVTIEGTLEGVQPNSVHVRMKKMLTLHSFSIVGFSCARNTTI